MKFTKSFFITIILLAILSLTVSAAATSKILSTNYTLVNLGTSTANVSATYYKTDGSVWDAADVNENFTIEGNYGQKIIAQYFDPTLSSGEGSVVISSDQPLGAISQILARNQTPTSGAYMGVVSPSNKFYAPQVFRSLNTANGLVNSQIIIQNTETSDVNVNVIFVPFPGLGLSGYTKSAIVIKPGASYVYDLSNEAGLSTGWSGSAVISSGVGTEIAVVVNSFAGPNSLQTYNAFPESIVSPGWAIPQFVSKLSNGLNTVVLVQNLSGTEIPINDLTLSCVAASGFTPSTFTVKNSTTVPANAIYAYNPYGSSDAVFPRNWSGTCDVSSTTLKNSVVLVQMRRPGVSEELATYEAIPSNSTDTKVVVPLISKNQANGFATATTIKNLDKTNPAEVTLVYTPSTAYVSGGGSATVITFDATITAGGNLIQSQRLNGTPQLPNGWYGSLLVKPKLGSTPRPIGALVQLTNIYPQPGDTFMTHMAFTQP